MQLPFHSHMQAYKGLINYGATCYINATIQAFMHSIPTSLAIHFADIDQAVFDSCVGGFEQDATGANCYPEQNSFNTVACLQILQAKAEHSLQQELGTRSLCASIGKRELSQLNEQDDADAIQKKLAECLENVYKAKNLSDERLTLLRNAFKDVIKAPIEGQIDLYNALLISKQKQQIVCGECNYESATDSVITSVQLSLSTSFFDSLALYFKREQLDGYKCSRCQKEACYKAMAVTDIAALLLFSLSRFVLDYTTYEYRKDGRPMEMPSCLDVFGLMHVRETQLELDELVSEYLRCTCMPWVYPPADASEPVKKAIEGVPGLAEYLKAYNGISTTAAFADAPDQPDPFYVFPAFEQAPEHFYIMNAVVIHTGTIQTGHYYTYANKFDAAARNCVFYAFNDQMVSQLQYPFAQLKTISGKDDELQENDQRQAHLSRSFSDTGYMYYYTKYALFEHQIPTTSVLTDKLRYEINNENTEAEKTIYKYNLSVLTNFCENLAEMTPFSVFDQFMQPLYNFQLQDYDIRVRMSDFVAQFNFPALHFNVYQTHATRDAVGANVRRYRKVFDGEKDADLLLSVVSQKFQASKRVAARKLHLFIEFFTPETPRFDPEATYLIFKQVRLIDDQVATQLQHFCQTPAQFASKMVSDNYCGNLEILSLQFVPIDLEVLNERARAFYESSTDGLYNTNTMELWMQALHLKLAFALYNSTGPQDTQRWLQYALVYGVYENGEVNFLSGSKCPTDQQSVKVYSGQQFYIEVAQKQLPASICGLLNYTQADVPLEELSLLWSARSRHEQCFNVMVYAGEFLFLTLEAARDSTVLQLRARIQESEHFEQDFSIYFCALTACNEPQQITSFSFDPQCTLQKITLDLAPHLRTGLHFQDGMIVVQVAFARPMVHQLYFQCAPFATELQRAIALPIPVNFIGKTAREMLEQNTAVRKALERRVALDTCSLHAIGGKIKQPRVETEISTRRLTEKHKDKISLIQAVPRGAQALEFFGQLGVQFESKSELGIIVRVLHDSCVDQCAFVRAHNITIAHIRAWAERAFGASGLQIARLERERYVQLEDTYSGLECGILYAI